MTAHYRFDVLVIGGGHAGCEAAAAAARAGARTALLTLRPDDIGALSCNPAIGGIGKGQLVREIDALDGIMAHAADTAAIHFRLLNRSKGPAVHGPRVQLDRQRYRRAVRHALNATPGLELLFGEVLALVLDGTRVVGVDSALGIIHAGATVLTTGTYLGGKLFTGATTTPGGRRDAPPASALAASVRQLGLPGQRLKTGTPPRLDGRTIDWSRIAWQASDTDPMMLSTQTVQAGDAIVACGITQTNARTHDVIRARIDEAPVQSGAIQGRGPRYCPSIEDKVLRFADRTSHQIFLEPEALGAVEVYPNGISTALPAEVQTDFVRTIAGLERAEIRRFGYAVEYDMIDPRALAPTLQVCDHPGLLLAGQINGSTGYEEAAGQGLVAGANAAAAVLGRVPLHLDRASSYLGVMIDDLTTQGASEPYRMFTSRAEYRLRLRLDTAAERLTPAGVASGVIGPTRAAAAASEAAALDRLRELLASRTLTPHVVARAGVTVRQDGEARSVLTWLQFEQFDADVARRLVPELAAVPGHYLERLVNDARYLPYLARQDDELAAFRRNEALLLPPTLDYAALPGLSTEMVQRLRAAQPATFGAAARTAGVTPAALSSLLAFARKAA